MALFRRPRRTSEAGESDPGTDTVGNPIVGRQADARHAAPEAGPTRAELRMLQFVTENRIVRTVMSNAAAEFWRVDGAFATGTKAMMLDWLLSEGYIEIGERVRISAPVVLTDRGYELLDGAG